ncbi:glycosyltransferase [Desulforamulus ferrireducens]|uniref:Glycosyltransferase n=1 Tax=Desulforamulus ferrireducens TaxID=1833852 RepID=A0A1S6IVJ7_9FIRM|nr:glycosyltransferase [Desulforamulus ferrireducens]AQS58808.1 hypothetical protein B0537_06760 [Desulforamulus ferrireducens]
MIRGKEIMDQIDLEIGKLTNQQTKLTLLFVLDRLEIVGGLETHLYHLCRELRQRGHKIIVDCASISTTLQELFSFVEIYQGKTVAEMGEIIRTNEVDLIHCQPFHSAERALVLHEQTKVPFVLTWHGAYYMDNFPQIAQKLEKVICVSEEVYDLLLEKYPLVQPKLVIIQNGIDLNEFAFMAPQQETKEITFIGRDCADRLVGLKYLIESVSMTSFQKINIVGFKSRPELQPDHLCNFVGEVTDVKKYIQRADVVVATGRGVREAIACGKPCIVLSHWGYDGILCPSTFKILEYANFSGRGLAEPLASERIRDDLNLLTSSELRVKLGLYGRRLAEKYYDIKKIADQTEIVYLQAVKNSKSPKVSILLPVYNQAKVVGQCLTSLLNQTCQDFEIILIDDGSTDSLSQVVSEFPDQRIRYIRREKHKGLPWTLNEALRLSQGKYITWLSAADLPLANYLEKLLEVLEREPECGSVYSDYLEIDEKANVIQNISKGLYQLNGEISYGPSFLYRIEAMQRAGFFDENLADVADKDYAMRLAATAPVFWLPEILYKHRILNKKSDNEFANKAFFKKWQWLRQYPHLEAKPMARDKVIFGEKVILPINMDCTVNSTMNKNLNYDAILLGNFRSSIYRCFVQVDINSILTGSQILRAEFQFFCTRNDNNSVQEITVHQVKEPWEENTVSWFNMPEIENEPIAEAQVGEIYNWVSFDITGLVQRWADGNTANYGICLRMKDEDKAEVVAGLNRHGDNPIAYPRLVVEYTGKDRCLTC